MKHLFSYLLLCCVCLLPANAQITYMTSQQHHKTTYPLSIKHQAVSTIGSMSPAPIQPMVSQNSTQNWLGSQYLYINVNAVSPVNANGLLSEDTYRTFHRATKSNKNDSDDDDDFGSGNTGNTPGDPGNRGPVGDALLPLLLMAIVYLFRIRYKTNSI